MKRWATSERTSFDLVHLRCFSQHSIRAEIQWSDNFVLRWCLARNHGPRACRTKRTWAHLRMRGVLRQMRVAIRFRGRDRIRRWTRGTEDINLIHFFKSIKEQILPWIIDRCTHRKCPAMPIQFGVRIQQNQDPQTEANVPGVRGRYLAREYKTEAKNVACIGWHGIL